MDAKLKKALEKFAEKHNLEVHFSCLFCGNKRESVGAVSGNPFCDAPSHFVTLTQKPAKKGKHVAEQFRLGLE
jgi:hypothetical protein